MAWLPSWHSFLKVVESGSMAAAARQLDCTRAQVSKQIGDLERSLGQRLFERATRRLSLTPAGEVFLQHARRALEAVDSAELALRHLGETPQGVLRISATLAFGRRYITPLLPSMVEKYPGLECELVLTDQLVDLVADRIDLALRLTKAPPEDAVARPLLQLERHLCAAPAYLAAHGTPQTPQDLPLHRCFSYLFTDDGHWRLTDREGAEIRVPIHSPLRYNNLECLEDAILAGQGIGILPDFLCAPALADGRLIRVLPDHEPQVRFGRHLYACYTPSRIRLPKVKVFLAELEAALTPVPPWRQGWK